MSARTKHDTEVVTAHACISWAAGRAPPPAVLWRAPVPLSQALAVLSPLLLMEVPSLRLHCQEGPSAPRPLRGVLLPRSPRAGPSPSRPHRGDLVPHPHSQEDPSALHLQG